MSLRFRVILIVVLAITALVSAVIGVFYRIILPGFSALEQEELMRDMQNGVNVLQNELDDVTSTGRDWAYWDDTYAFVQDHNEAYIRNNLKPADLKTILVNLIVVLDQDKRVVFSRAIDFESLQETQLPPDLPQFLERSAPMLETIDVTCGFNGIVLLADHPLLMSAWPILDSNQLTPRRGTLIFGRYFDRAQIDKISRATSLSLDVFRVDDPGLDAGVGAVFRSMMARNDRQVIRTLSEDQIVGYALVDDVFDRPAILMRVVAPRPVHREARNMLIYFQAALVGLGLFFILLTILFINRTVVSRLLRLNREVVRIGEEQDFERQVSVSGRDELAELGIQVNHMLTRLNIVQSKLQQRNHSLEVSNRMITEMSRAENRAGLLENSLQGIVKELDFSGGAVLGLDHEKRRSVLEFQAHLSETMREAIEALPFESKPLQEVFWSGKDYWVEEGTAGQDPASSVTKVYLPVVIREQVEVILFFYRTPALVYNDAQRDTLATMQRGLAIELERLQSEMLVRQLNKELTLTLQAKDDFLATVSHELKIPLNVIFGMSAGLLEGRSGPLNEQQAQSIAKIHENVNTLMGMITNVLDLSNIQTGRLTLQRDWTMVKNLCDLSVRMVETQARSKGIKLTFSIDDPERAIWVDQRRIRQVLIILLGNAIRYTPEGGEVNLKVSSEAHGDRTQFIVEDTGVGIDPEKQSNLFNPFSIINRGVARSRAGAGLGLALVDGLVSLHGGEINLESTLGKGSRFTISLPAYPGDGNGIQDEDHSIRVRSKVDPI